MCPGHNYCCLRKGQAVQGSLENCSPEGDHKEPAALPSEAGSEQEHSMQVRKKAGISTLGKGPCQESRVSVPSSAMMVTEAWPWRPALGQERESQRAENFF